MLDKIHYVLRDDRDAVAYFLALHSVLHLWDDLIDRDHVPTPAEVDEAMWNALIAVPNNPFFLRHITSLSALTVNAIANWKAANQFEGTEDERLLHLAFVIRSDYANILLHCAFLVGGREWMMEVTPLVRQLWTDETFSDYLRNLDKERERRESAEV